MTRQDDREAAHSQWLFEIQDKHPNCWIIPTLTGCAVYNAIGEVVKEYDYEPDPHEAARVRY